jgi:hypothetical protein
MIACSSLLILGLFQQNAELGSMLAHRIYGSSGISLMWISQLPRHANVQSFACPFPWLHLQPASQFVTIDQPVHGLNCQYIEFPKMVQKSLPISAE